MLLGRILVLRFVGCQGIHWKKEIALITRRWGFIAPTVLAWSLLFGLTCAAQVPLSPLTSLRLTPNSPSAQFLVFDGTYFTNKPDLSSYGIQPLNLVYESTLFSADLSGDAMPQTAAIQSVANACMTAQGITVLDVERWIGLPNAAGLYVQLASSLKAACPGLKLGYYSVVPERDYWRAITASTATHFSSGSRKTSNFSPLPTRSITCSLRCTHSTTIRQAGWRTPRRILPKPAGWLTENLCTPFSGLTTTSPILYWEAHLSPPDFWRLELDTVRQLADGVVIWGGGGNWDPNAPWWLVTQQFLVSLQPHNP